MKTFNTGKYQLTIVQENPRRIESIHSDQPRSTEWIDDERPTPNGQAGNRNTGSHSDWPIWARAMRQFSKLEDKGIGDVVARIIGDENSTAFKAFYLKVTGKTCGCTGRQEKWNLKFPLRSDATP